MTNKNQIDIIFCDDSKPMEKHPPLTSDEIKKHNAFWEKMKEKFFKNPALSNL